MLTRRQVVLGTLAGAAVPALTVCSPTISHEEAALALWRHGSIPPGDRGALLRELVRYATLAPSSHNSQCWKFRLGERAITIEPDLARRCPAVDPDDHHLFVSLGCAVENLAQAALAYGLNAEARYAPGGSGSISVVLESTQPLASPLFQAIPQRQRTRGDYDGRPLAVEELRRLEQAGNGKGVRVMLLTERQAMEKVLEYVVAALRPQFASWLGVGPRRPDLVVRFGRGPRLPPSLRRPVQAVLV